MVNNERTASRSPTGAPLHHQDRTLRLVGILCGVRAHLGRRLGRPDAVTDGECRPRGGTRFWGSNCQVSPRRTSKARPAFYSTSVPLKSPVPASPTSSLDCQRSRKPFRSSVSVPWLIMAIFESISSPFFTAIGVLSTCSVIFAYKPELFWLIALLVVLINMFSGMTLVFYNSYLPLLTQNHPDYLEAVEKETQTLEELESNERHTPASTQSAEQQAEAMRHRNALSEATVKVGERLSNWISTIGFMSGYAAALILVGLCAAMLYIFQGFGEQVLTQLCIVGVGIWWGIVSDAIWRLEYQSRPALPHLGQTHASPGPRSFTRSPRRDNCRTPSDT